MPASCQMPTARAIWGARAGQAHSESATKASSPMIRAAAKSERLQSICQRAGAAPASHVGSAARAPLPRPTTAASLRSRSARRHLGRNLSAGDWRRRPTGATFARRVARPSGAGRPRVDRPACCVARRLCEKSSMRCESFRRALGATGATAPIVRGSPGKTAVSRPVCGWRHGCDRPPRPRLPKSRRR